MNRFNFFTLSIVTILFSSQVFSQTVSGIILDGKDKSPVSPANIISLRVGDSTFVSGTTSNEKGVFTIDITGAELLMVSHIGYKSKTITVREIADLKYIYLEADTNTLKEVVIRGRNDKIKFSENGLILNVQNSVLNKIGKAADVLARIPLVVAKGSDYTVFGKGKPQIYINDRLLRDNIELQQISSSEIKSVELLLSPGALYSSETGAVIKITLKKPIGDGLGLLFSTGSDITRKFSYDNTLSLNYRKKGLDLFGSISGFNRKSLEYVAINNLMNFPGENFSVTGMTNQLVHGKRWLSTIGFNKQIKKIHSFGTKYIFSDMPVDNRHISQNYNSYIDNVFTRETQSVDIREGFAGYHYLNAYYLGKLSAETSVKLDFDYSSGDSKERADIAKTTSNNTTNISTLSKGQYNLIAGKLKLDSDLFKGQLTYGGEYSHTEDNPEFSVLQNTPSNVLLPVKNRSEQNLLALFASYNKNLEKFSFEIGLRYENSNFSYIENGLPNNLNSKSYNRLLPSLSLTLNGKKIRSSLSYRSTINRPSYFQLANSVNFINEYIYSAGNPYLLPTKKDEINYTFFWKNYYAIVSYSFLSNKIIHNLTQYGTQNIILNQPVNVDKSRVLALACGCSIEKGVWQADVEFSMLKQNLQTGSPVVCYNNPVFLARIQNSFNLPENFTILFSLSGNTKGSSDITEYQSKYRADAGIIKTMVDGKLRLNVLINDIFKTDFENWEMGVNNIVLNQRKNSDTRGITISLTLRLNSARSKYKGTTATGELDRLTKF